MTHFFAIKKNSIQLVCIFLLTLIFSCKKESTVTMLPIDQQFYILSDNYLIGYNSKSAKTQLSKIAVTGIATNEKLLNIDFRPATGELYGVSSLNKLYTINTISGIAKAVAETAFTPTLSGSKVNIDFNPTTDQLRVVTSSGQNFRLNPETGALIASDANLSNTNISGIAHHNNFTGATTSILYDIDYAAKKLLKQDGSTLTQIGDLGIDLGANLSFDISSNGENAFATGQTPEGFQLFSINLGTGTAKMLGTFTNVTAIQGIAMQTNPVAYVINNDNNLVILDLNSSNAYSKTITGLQTGETIKGMDMRPANGQIYVLGSNSRLYTLSTSTGTLSLVGTLTTVLSGTNFGFDFNPVLGTLDVVSNNGQNISIDPTNATVTVHPNITTTTATLSAAAYNNNFRGATTTTLYVIDHTIDKLYTENPTTGVITAVADLTLDGSKLVIEGSNGFDIISTSSSNRGFAFFTVGGLTKLYAIDLSTGVATAAGTFNGTVNAFTLGLKF